MLFFLFKHKTAYEMRISDWSSDVCSSDLVDEINPETDRVHTTFAMTVASTGRLSSTEPNLQNIPIRTEEGRKIRQAFVAAPGHVLLSELGRASCGEGVWQYG